MASYTDIEIKFLFDQLLEQMVRLYGFCSIRSDYLEDLKTTIEDKIDDIFDAVFKRDLLVFAASLRSFSERIGLHHELRNIRLPDCEINLAIGPPYFQERTTETNLHRCASRVLHSINIDVHREVIDFCFAVGKKSTEIDDIFEREKASGLGPPLIEIETESDGKYFVSLEHFLAAASKFLDLALTELQRREIFEKTK